ncbi:MAG: response regulator [Alteromonadaceae bacterium]|nr:response regulator [Alteromonadaceae bacterium]
MELSVLLIDDDPIIHTLLVNALPKNITLHEAFDGDEGIEKATALLPDIILLDVEMPGRNGYETCEILKAQSETKQIPVIFSSSLGEIRHRMLGYEAGADDYLVKPFAIDELCAKLFLQHKLLQEQVALNEQKMLAQSTAMSAMTASSEMGRVIQFVELTYGMNNPDTLASKLFELLNTLELKTSVLFSLNDGVLLYSSSGTTSPLESELLQNCHEHGRFIDFGCRTIINYPKISLLIKNMPLDDLEKYGRYKDLFPAVLGATDAKLRMMETDFKLKQQAVNTDVAFKAIRKQLFGLVEGQLKTQESTLGEFRQFHEEFNWDLTKMGLEESLEASITSRVDTMLNSAESIFEKNISDQSSTLEVLDHMKSLTNQLEELIESAQEEVMFAQGEEISLEDSEQSGYEMDVELF